MPVETISADARARSPREKHRQKLAFAAILSACTLFACAPSQVSLAEGPRSYTANDYDEVLARWTREGRLIALSELDGLLAIAATFESWDFQSAYVSRYARDYRLSQAEKQALLESSLEATRQHHEFYIALSGENRRWVDLSQPSSAWVVRLVDDRGNETAPLEIVAIPKPGPSERTYFPYTSVWRYAFRARFPVTTPEGPTIAPDASLVGLKFSGPKGEKTLVWELISK